MKALVTGATGFIGSSIVRELLKDGAEVTAMVREKSDTRNIDGLDIKKVYGDIRDAASMASALKGCDVFYQTAALYVRWAPEKLYYDINVEGTKTALNAALRQGVPRVVYTSSIAAVGYSGTEKPADERTEFNWLKTGTHYIRSKYLGEQAALDICKQGLPVVIVNPAWVIGVRDIKSTPSGELMLNVLNRMYPGYRDGGTNFVDVEDVARGHILAAKKGKIGERYILGNTNMSYKDFFKLVGEIAGVAVPEKKIPSQAVIALGYMYQLISGITRKPPLIDSKSARLSCAYLYYDCSKAVKELGMPQTQIRTTVEKAVNWFKENGYVKSGLKT